MKQITVEQVDQQIAEIEKQQVKMLPASAGKAQIDISKICAIVKKAVPILKFANGLLFWKPKWQKIISQVIETAGTLCP